VAKENRTLSIGGPQSNTAPQGTSAAQGTNAASQSGTGSEVGNQAPQDIQKRDPEHDQAVAALRSDREKLNQDAAQLQKVRAALDAERGALAQESERLARARADLETEKADFQALKVGSSAPSEQQKVREPAGLLSLVKMRRQYPELSVGPDFADVHPDEVVNMIAGGWRVVE
jgi:hypothetical protein